MADYIVACMLSGDLKAIKDFTETLDSINEHIYLSDDNELNLLHLAAGLDSNYREEILELLIECRADLNCPGKSEGVENVRALHLAAMWGHDMTVKLLLFHGADASLRDTNELSPIDYASVFDNYACITLLLRYGSLNSTASAWSAIMENSFGDSSLDNVLHRATKESSFAGDDYSTDTSSQQHSFLSESDEENEHGLLDSIREEDVDYNMDKTRLKQELKRFGWRDNGPITPSTKRLYAKLLVRLKKDDSQYVFSPKTKDKIHGYSTQLNDLLTCKFSFKQALELEKEFICISSSQVYHTTKQFFNYILVDPRISRNLPEEAMEDSDSDTSRRSLEANAMRRINRKFNPKLFARFLESIFYIGKGQKKRDLMHLYDALADRGSITKRKIDQIRSIWDDGFGVVSLHLFHNITSKEALTREALMIEVLGLKNLTNLVKGTIQIKLKWNEAKRNRLGTLLLFRAYNQLLNEGERQLKREDLKVSK